MIEHAASGMSYETLLPPNGAPSAPRTHFHGFERFAFLLGAVGAGGVSGFIAAVAVGRQDLWTQLLGGAPVLALALCLACATFVEARRCALTGCSIMAGSHGVALIAWPLFIPLHPTVYWIAPAAAMTSVLLLASCWSGSPGAIYRSAAQAMLVAALAAYQGVLIVLG
jgi:hypothetical protein